VTTGRVGEVEETPFEGWMGIELFKLGRSSTDTICRLTSSAVELKDERALEEFLYSHALGRSTRKEFRVSE